MSRREVPGRTATCAAACHQTGHQTSLPGAASRMSPPLALSLHARMLQRKLNAKQHALAHLRRIPQGCSSSCCSTARMQARRAAGGSPAARPVCSASPVELPCMCVLSAVSSDALCPKAASLCMMFLFGTPLTDSLVRDAGS